MPLRPILPAEGAVIRSQSHASAHRRAIRFPMLQAIGKNPA